MSPELRAAIRRSRWIKHEIDPRDARIKELEKRVAELEDQLTKKVPRLSSISHTVSGFYGIGVDAIKSSSRSLALVRARHIAWWLCRVLKESPYSYSQIGNHFNRDHTTVIHGINLIEVARKTDAVIAADIKTLSDKFTTPEPVHLEGN